METAFLVSKFSKAEIANIASCMRSLKFSNSQFYSRTDRWCNSQDKFARNKIPIPSQRLLKKRDLEKRRTEHYLRNKVAKLPFREDTIRWRKRTPRTYTHGGYVFHGKSEFNENERISISGYGRNYELAPPRRPRVAARVPFLSRFKRLGSRAVACS